MQNTDEGIKVILAGLLIDGLGDSPTKDAAVLVQGGRIKAVGARAQVNVPQDAEVVDCSSYTVMPGLIDTHLHLHKANVAFYKNYQLAQIVYPPSFFMLTALRGAQIMLESGFTTVRSHPHFLHYEPRAEVEAIAMRDAVNCGLFPGPRLLVGGRYVHITSSHFDLTQPRLLSRADGVTADGPWELRRQVRENLRTGSDFVKTCLSGGGGTSQEEPDVRNMTQEEINAIVDESHAFLKPCSAHCFTPLSQKMAVRAGVDTIDHCVFTDDEAIEMIKGEDKFLVPTLSHRSDRAIEARMSVHTPEDTILKMKRLQPICWETFKRIHQAGIKIAMGTDTQVDPEIGTNAYELELYVMLGMTPMEAIQTATKNAAEAIWLGKDTGTIETGKYADITVVDGNPLSDIRILQNKEKIKLVFTEGRLAVDRTGEKKTNILHQPIANKR
jgi:imidazolonepropionase-like amidohydrolase